MRVLRAVSRRILIVAALTTMVAACGGGGGDGPTTPPTPVPVTIAVSPTTASVNAGAVQTFSATVSNGRTGGVNWSASGGTIVGTGTSATWTAPLAGGSYTVTATSTDDNTKAASATVTVTAIAVAINTPTATVASGATQTFSATVTGTTNTAVQWTASAGVLSSTVGSSVTWTAPPTGGTALITATSNADPTRSASSTVTITPVVVAVSATALSVGAAGQSTLTAAVSGGIDSSVTWQASGGTISGTGRTVSWLAPATAGLYTIRAISRQDASRADSVRVTVTPVVVTLTSSTIAPFRGQPVTLNATVTGAAPGT